MRIETKRLLITDFIPELAEAVHLNSLNEDTRRFVPDKMFETIDEAAFGKHLYQGQERPIKIFHFKHIEL